MYLAFYCSSSHNFALLLYFSTLFLVDYDNVWIYFGLMFGSVWILIMLLSSFWCCQRGRELERTWVRNQLSSKVRHTCQKIGGVRVVWTCYHLVYSLSWFQDCHHQKGGDCRQRIKLMFWWCQRITCFSKFYSRQRNQRYSRWMIKTVSRVLGRLH